MGLVSAIVSLWPISHEDLLPPEHGLDYEAGDMVMFAVPSGKTFLGNITDVCDPELNGDVWMRIEYTMVIDDRPYTVATWLIDGHVELIEKNTAA